MIASTVGVPLRSSSALVATVVPILTASTASSGRRSPLRQAQQVADALDRRILVLLGVLREQLVDPDRPVRRPADHVGERAAAIDPELPAGIHDPATSPRRARAPL